MSLSPYTLWSDTARTRFFLIPDDEQLPPGDFDLRTITGGHLKVDAAALAEFEISEPAPRLMARICTVRAFEAITNPARDGRLSRGRDADLAASAGSFGQEARGRQ